MLYLGRQRISQPCRIFGTPLLGMTGRLSSVLAEETRMRCFPEISTNSEIAEQGLVLQILC